MADSNMMLYIIFFCLVVFIFHFRNYFRAVILAFRLKGPPALPILGNVFIINQIEEAQRLAVVLRQHYGRIIRGWITILPCFIIVEPDDLQIIMGSYKYTDKNFFYGFLHNVLGEGLITSFNDKSKVNRKLIQPYFQIKVIEKFIDTFGRYSKKLVDNLDDAENFNIVGDINSCVVDILYDAVLGIKDEDIRNTSPYRSGKVYLPHRILKPWLLVDSIFKYTSLATIEVKQKENLQSYTKKVMEYRKSLKTKPTDGNKCLLDTFLEIRDNNPDVFTEKDVINETCTFMLAGQDSVSSSIVFSLYFLAKYVDIQKKVRHELKSIFDNDDRPPTLNDLSDMKYLEQCIKEAMRICPSVPLLIRQLKEDITLGSYTLPRGAQILISPFATHRLSSIYPDPLEYDPERFSINNIQKLHSYSFIPFGAGPRICIGNKFAMMEMKTIISTLIRNFDFELADPFKKLDLSYRVTWRLKGGLRLHLKRIKKGK